MPVTYCGGCGASLGGLQCWCVECGARVPGAARDPKALLAAAPVSEASSAVLAPAATMSAASRLLLFPGLDVPLKVAFATFAAVLGFASWAGAASIGIGGKHSYMIAQQPPAAQAPLLPDQQPPTDVTPITDPVAPPTDAFVQPAIVPTMPPVDNYVPPPPPPPLKPDEGTDSAAEHIVPTLSHVWLVVLGNQGYSADTGLSPLFDVSEAKLAKAKADSGKPYLAGKVAPTGAVLQNLFATARGSLADHVALISGQGARAATKAGCTTFSEFSKDGVGANGQALDSTSCGFGPKVPTIFSALSAAGRTAKTYSGAIDSDPSLAAAACTRPEVGKPFPVGLPAAALFAGFTATAKCTDTVSGAAALSTDLASVDSTPAFSLILPGPCQDGNLTPCAPGKPAGLGPADEFLHDVLPKIFASDAYKNNGAVFIVSDQSATTDYAGKPLDPDAALYNSACCGDRPWYADQGTSGGGNIGALVVSPLIKGGSPANGSFSGDHFDLLNTISRSLGVAPPGYASNSKVTGFPKSIWSKWNGRKPAPGAS